MTALRLFLRTFPHFAYFSYVSELRKQLRGCSSVLEIGCGADSPARPRFTGIRNYVGIDGHEPTIIQAREADPEGDYRVGYAEDLDFPDGAFDAVCALDLIEHLTKEDGLKFIGTMNRIAAKKVILFTPNGFLPQQSHDGDLQEHLSGWTAGEMRTLGFQVVGMHGPKSLRGEQHVPKIRPHVLGAMLCQLGQLYTRHVPEKAAAILCAKDVPSRPLPMPEAERQVAVGTRSATGKKFDLR